MAKGKTTFKRISVSIALISVFKLKEKKIAASVKKSAEKLTGLLF